MDVVGHIEKGELLGTDNQYVKKTTGLFVYPYIHQTLVFMECFVSTS